MARTELSLERFEHLLDLYGSTFACWPAEDTEAAHMLLADNWRARQMLGHARNLDGHLAAAMQTHPLPAERIGRIMAGLDRRRGREAFTFLMRPRAAMAFMAVAVMVFGLGAWTGGVAQTTSDQITLASVDFTDQVWSGFNQ